MQLNFFSEFQYIVVYSLTLNESILDLKDVFLRQVHSSKVVNLTKVTECLLKVFLCLYELIRAILFLV